MKQNRIWPVLFGLYCALMLWLLFDRSGSVPGISYWEQVKSNLNLVPFRTLRLFTGLLSDHRPHLVQGDVVNPFSKDILLLPL